MNPNKLEFTILKNPYNDVAIYSDDTLSLNPGLTVLVGCNGSGKSTLLWLIKDQCDEMDIKVMMYDNLVHGQNTARQIQLDSGDISGLVQRVTSSEGEELFINIGQFVAQLGYTVRNAPKGSNLVVCFDASDSGLSIDAIASFKDAFNNCIIPDAASNDVVLYVVVSANEFEMCNGSDCIDVQTLSHVGFTNYNSYREFILKSYDNKMVRYDKLNDRAKSKNKSL